MEFSFDVENLVYAEIREDFRPVELRDGFICSPRRLSRTVSSISSSSSNGSNAARRAGKSSSPVPLDPITRQGLDRARNWELISDVTGPIRCEIGIYNPLRSPNFDMRKKLKLYRESASSFPSFNKTEPRFPPNARCVLNRALLQPSKHLKLVPIYRA